MNEAQPTPEALTPVDARDLLVLLNRVQTYKGLQEAERAVKLGLKLQAIAAQSQEENGKNADSTGE